MAPVRQVRAADARGAHADEGLVGRVQEENPEAYEKPPEEPAEETEEEAD